MADPVMALAEFLGVLPRYTDTTGTERITSRDTAEALVAALGHPLDNDAQAAETLAELQALAQSRAVPDYAICNAWQTPKLDVVGNRSWQLTFEDGGQVEGHGAQSLPVLPLGIHRLWINGDLCTLLAAPPRLNLPSRAWGLMVPLYGLWMDRQTGLGDYESLGRLAADVGRHGAAFVGINPVHAGFPTDPNIHSPYTPSHRRRLNLLHIRTPGGAKTGSLIDYPAEIQHQMDQLRSEFHHMPDCAALQAFTAEGGEALCRFALHQALSDRFGPFWTDWPREYREPSSDAVHSAHAELHAEIAFHQWAQWRAHQELSTAQDTAKAAGLSMGLYLDLAVGTHPAGAETWEDRESFATGVSLGAPPDALGPQGQTWNLAPLHPRQLINKSFEVLAETLRVQFSYCGLLRIDHILGFERAFWVPDTGAPGGYVAMPRDAMLAVTRIEAQRADCTVIGEDLGVVPDGLRSSLAGSNVLGCCVAIFEQEDGVFRDSSTYPQATIASFSTHDLPTWTGWRAGADLVAWAEIGTINQDKLEEAETRRAHEIDAFDACATDQTRPTNSAEALHEFLARSNAVLVTVQIENVLGIDEQPNLPGTIHEYPNWRQRLPIEIDTISNDNRLTGTSKIMKDAERDPRS